MVASRWRQQEMKQGGFSMKFIHDVESWDMVQRLDAKAAVLYKPLAAQVGLSEPRVCGSVVRMVWEWFLKEQLGRDHYPYSPELLSMTAGINRSIDVALEPWHVWGLLHRAHKKEKNFGTHMGKWSPYLRESRERYGISIEQMRAMGQIPLRLAGKLGDDVAMTHIVTRATNELFRKGWGDWFDDRFTFNAMVSLRKARKAAAVHES
jgi:hypothetical protein